MTYGLPCDRVLMLHTLYTLRKYFFFHSVFKYSFTSMWPHSGTNITKMFPYAQIYVLRAYLQLAYISFECPICKKWVRRESTFFFRVALKTDVPCKYIYSKVHTLPPWSTIYKHIRNTLKITVWDFQRNYELLNNPDV